MANEVEIKVSDQFISRGGFGAAKKGMKDLESEARKSSKSVGDAFSDLEGKVGRSGSKSSSSFASNFASGLGGVKDAFTANMAELGPAGVALAAPAGALAASGIVVAFGAGLAGMGLAFAENASSVKHEMADLKSDITAEMQSASKPLEAVWMRFSDGARSAIQKIKPELAHAFEDMAPDLGNFSDNLFKGFGNLSKAIDPLQNAFSAVLNDIGPRLPALFDDIADSLDDLADSVEKNPHALGDMVDGISNVVTAGIKLTGWANDTWAAMKPLLSMGQSWSGDLVADGMAAVANKTKELGDAGDRTTPAMRQVAEALAEIGDEAADAESQASALKTLMDQLTGQTPTYTEGLQSGSDALRDMSDAFGTAEERAKGFGNTLINQQGAFDVTTENGSKLYDQVQDVTSSFDTMAAAVANGQGSREGFIADASRMRDGLNETWRAAGLTEDQIAHLNQVYGLTPDLITTRVDLLGVGSAEAQLGYLARTRTASIYIQTLGGGSVNGQTTFHDIYGHGGVTSTAATGGARGGEVTMNERGSEQVRLPDGSRVLTAEASRAWEQGMFDSRTGGGGSQEIVLRLPSGGTAMDRLLVAAIKESFRNTGVKVAGLTT